MGSQLNSCARAAYLALVALAAPATIAAQVVVRGIVYDDSTGARLAAAGVLLVDPRTDAPVANTKTDSVGQFILKSSKGVYQIAAVREGYTSVLSASRGDGWSGPGSSTIEANSKNRRHRPSVSSWRPCPAFRSGIRTSRRPCK